MCGIAGMFARPGAPIHPEWGDAALEALQHRGPDGSGRWSDDRALFLFRRLSIIDLSATGNQPMTSEDGNVVTMMNGELYNFRELRRSLIGSGHQFRGSCDAEVIAHAYEEQGEACFDRFHGMFAIAIYDARRRRLILARDRFGIKPLYLTSTPGATLFASEMKALLAHPDVARRIDSQAIHDYLSLSFIPEPATGFAAIRALEPGAVLIIEDDRNHALSMHRMADVPGHSGAIDSEIEGRTLLDGAVASQLVSDAPLGAFLSGGIDSSAIVESASRQMTAPLPAFNVKFPDAAYDESRFARVVAEACGAEYHELQLQAQGADPDLVARVCGHFDQPFGDSSAIPTYLISREMRRFVKVALSGDGGDEVFGGYELFWRLPALRKVGAVPAPIRRAAAALLRSVEQVRPDFSRQASKALAICDQPNARLLYSLSAYLDEAQKTELYGDSDAHRVAPTWRLFETGLAEAARGGEAISKYITDRLFKLSLHGDMLKKVDMMSMLAGLEVRVPMLDERLVAFAFSLPAREKVGRRRGKLILRRLLAGRLPASVLDKKKWGFGIPLDTWSSPAFTDFLRDVLLAPTARSRPFADARVVAEWLDAFSGKRSLLASISRAGLYQRIFMLLSLELWMQRYSLSA
jgi:asparagine synthase (glutamine-hydrolysing)